MLATNLKIVAVPEVAREVLIPTATVIVCDIADPWRILIGTSSKHGKPVLPGGKIDQEDLTSSSLEVCAARCARRELREEIGAEALCLSLLTVSEDRERDVRTIPVRSLKGSIAEQCVEGMPPETLVTGRYGVPDFLFVAPIDASMVCDTEELKGLTWMDCRTLDGASLGAGHSAFVRFYRDGLERSESK